MISEIDPSTWIRLIDGWFMVNGRRLTDTFERFNTFFQKSEYDPTRKNETVDGALFEV